ncbi:ecto-NOX disulfide-thiol exchanger 2 [Hyposmocoma kahamanoa]|uniref:ecto-NOX disulfide-thiol exchanger 2 n=1 Tax=Hyposmocoma kahamanoa TaxID=1477025 RepID=UPI000E6D5D93|nr:ecto-NOX disulfide-thiol exchanger 2 [Hyposmocoma kahamanoa]
MSVNRRDRSRSPMRVGIVGRRRDKSESKNGKPGNGIPNSSVMSQQMMIPNMFSQGNMMMPGGMFPNMMMPNAIMPNSMIPPPGIEIMQGGSMEMLPQAPLDMAGLSGQSMQAAVPASMDMSMMGGMIMDPSMMSMYPNMGADISVIQKKEVLLKHCKLSPPSPGTAEPPRRNKPPGCRTIFVGGLPDSIRENVVREIFESYGRIHTLRLSTKNFCHIRFDRESSVDAAMMISGYHLKLFKDGKEEDEDTKANSGWLHVDYALSRDDQNEYERKQRQALRAQEQQMQQLAAQQQALGASSRGMTFERSPSPVRIQPFSNGAILQLAEKIKSEDNFATTLPTLIAWLERGECSKKTATQFYSMIQATNAHIRRLFNEKVQAEEELQECKERVKNSIQKVIDQLEQVAKVFTAATHQRVWDHFTKPQRKNIETWQKMAQEFSSLKDEFHEKFYNEDSEFNGGYMKKTIDLGGSGEVLQLKRENESLKFQLEAYKNEVDVIKADAQKELDKFKAQFMARQALQEAFDNNPPLPIISTMKPPPPPPLPEDLDSKVHLKEAVEAGCGEAMLIGVISAFLQVHPQGASLDYVVSYVRALFSHVSQATVHHVLQKHTDVFQCTTTGVGANIEHRWSFVVFKNIDIV